jgi:hypothetical protein
LTSDRAESPPDIDSMIVASLAMPAERRLGGVVVGIVISA